MQFAVGHWSADDESLRGNQHNNRLLDTIRLSMMNRSILQLGLYTTGLSVRRDQKPFRLITCLSPSAFCIPSRGLAGLECRLLMNRETSARTRVCQAVMARHDTALNRVEFMLLSYLIAANVIIISNAVIFNNLATLLSFIRHLVVFVCGFSKPKLFPTN